MIKLLKRLCTRRTTVRIYFADKSHKDFRVHYGKWGFPYVTVNGGQVTLNHVGFANGGPFRLLRWFHQSGPAVEFPNV